MTTIDFDFIPGVMLGIEFPGKDYGLNIDWGIVIDLLILRITILNWTEEE